MTALVHRSASGTEITEVTLQANGLTAQIISFGAAVRSLTREGEAHSLILGYADISDYFDNAPYLGSIVGPVANRIEGARIALEGRSFTLDSNWLGQHTLHGGHAGTSHCNWVFESVTKSTATLTLTLKQGHMGFPGPIHLRTVYSLLASQTLDIKLSAETEMPCPINLAPHCYFNLDGDADLRSHELMIAAQAFTPVDKAGIPTGHIESVAGTKFDFRAPRPAQSADLDINFCLSDTKHDLRKVAELCSTASGRSLTIKTDQPGLQAFNAAALNLEQKLLSGRGLKPFAGLALEPQNWPNAPKLEQFPDCILRPGETYHSHSQFLFSQRPRR